MAWGRTVRPSHNNAQLSLSVRSGFYCFIEVFTRPFVSRIARSVASRARVGRYPSGNLRPREVIDGLPLAAGISGCSDGGASCGTPSRRMFRLSRLRRRCPRRLRRRVRWARCGSSPARTGRQASARSPLTRVRPGWTVARRTRMPPVREDASSAGETGSLHRLRRRRAGLPRWFGGGLTAGLRPDPRRLLLFCPLRMCKKRG
jgi:hypothetical protein